MKRLLLLGLVLFGMGQMDAFAQGKNTFEDDIYYTGSQAEKDAADLAKKQEAARKKLLEEQQNNEQQNAGAEERYYASTGEPSDGGYQEDYIDYDDDYYYSSRINRFNNPYYNRSYFSGFYNPFWYDRYWVDPYWGYNPWSSPGISVSFGYGPMWSSYWGWQNWYGYGGFGSYYNYPYYAGYGGYWGCGSPYYAGYWNGYYAGLYNNGYGNGYGNSGFRSASYGPRYSLNAVNNSVIRNNRNGFRTALANTTNANGTPIGPRRSGFRSSNPNDRSNAVRTGTGVRANPVQNGNVRSNSANTGRTGTFNDAARNMDNNVTEGRNMENRRNVSGNRYSQDGAAEEARPGRQRFSTGSDQQYNSGNRPATQPRYSQPSTEQPRYNQPAQQPRYEQRQAPAAQPRYERPAMSQPRMESAPRMQSSPRSSGDFGGGRSSGGFGGSRSDGGGGSRGRR